MTNQEIPFYRHCALNFVARPYARPRRTRSRQTHTGEGGSPLRSRGGRDGDGCWWAAAGWSGLRRLLSLS
jgi:hypothetical protein